MIDVNPSHGNKSQTNAIVTEVYRLLAFDPVARRIVRLHLNMNLGEENGGTYEQIPEETRRDVDVEVQVEVGSGNVPVEGTGSDSSGSAGDSGESNTMA